MEQNRQQPLRLIFQGNFTVENEKHASEIYDDLKIFVQSIQKQVMITGQLMRLLDPCCGQNVRVKPHEKTD